MMNSNINKEFVTYKQALALKELGFDDPCFGYHNIAYGDDSLGFSRGRGHINSKDKNFPSAPLYQQAFRWFRDNCNYHHYIEPIWRNNEVHYEFCVANSPSDNKEFEEGDIIESYEEAESKCLDKFIELFKK